MNALRQDRIVSKESGVIAGTEIRPKAPQNSCRVLFFQSLASPLVLRFGPRKVPRLDVSGCDEGSSSHPSEVSRFLYGDLNMLDLRLKLQGSENAIRQMIDAF
ncbi:MULTISPECIES: hypothetical protein [unclassified Rhizobium]|uniref:hypothetical protein n=1 Tax=unclassified Rhizobium TaxID=2613769 RepID=UPI00160B5A90|nr:MULTISPECIES: hypothetical protein [unclassified Rhizobium]MBB3319567.1 hypothetical protein [Rhizobium sp. BK181]MCS3742689.1 hypothetical protein [Rhizobium sp. BK661]MCS4095182.1 hypothetical protein [Rhizobium sp. BK176]